MQNRPQSCALHPMQDANAECRMQNRAQSYELAPDAGCRCRMQNAECRMQNRAQSQMPCTRCRMQDADAGCKIGLKAVSCTQRTNSLGLILHPAFCILRILHHAEESIWGPILHPASCILHAAHIQSNHFGLGSAFCIMHLHSAFSEKYRM